MNKVDLENDYLLNEQRIIWLAEDVEPELMERITAQLWYLRKKDDALPIRIYFRSNGGDSMVGLALANIITGMGRITGVLIGDTGSSAATIWAACERRVVYGTARLGIHPVTWQENYSKYDAAQLWRMHEQFRATDERQCAIYAAASKKDFAWWWTKYNLIGDVKWMDAAELVEIGMAERADSTSDNPSSGE